MKSIGTKGLRSGFQRGLGEGNHSPGKYDDGAIGAIGSSNKVRMVSMRDIKEVREVSAAATRGPIAAQPYSHEPTMSMA